ncbi:MULTISPECIES: 1-phosphofructokinase family hexose kinase [Actinokineospora]|uniref:1-phosphofructokinase n=1 Tax=Actinokineospora fastidiosa TaxID=1816 RepID=A0A918GPD1_9PSEU|nr:MULTISPECIES: PfkB family carbohydrate kinase [Actinokineospora]UVS78776.1 Tagatose-6-phosphate kinase [Actinokineospora sp. UTMC 2448]GGS46961.1 1-phosphofructokinase [Actinokineospora fastidiosa]
MTENQPSVVVFAPSPQLTVTVEEVDGAPDMHIHAGGQGVWQARMVAVLGLPVTLCGAFGGETGSVLRHLVDDGDITVCAREVSARNGAYVHDRRKGERDAVVEMAADPLSRHELDDLYAVTLREALAAGTAILAGVQDPGVAPPSLYRRLVADLGQLGCRVVVDLAGEYLLAAREGGPSVIKVSHQELLDAGMTDDDSAPALVRAADHLAETGAELVLVSRAGEPAIARTRDGVCAIEVPTLHKVDTRGAGDSMTAAVAVALALGEPMDDALRLGGAAGALNITRHGLGTGEGATIRAIARQVRLTPVER